MSDEGYESTTEDQIYMELQAMHRTMAAVESRAHDVGALLWIIIWELVVLIFFAWRPW